MVSERSKLRLNLSLGKKSRFRPTASTSTGGPLLTCCYRTEPTSTTHWSKMVGVGGIENMLLGTWSLKSWNEGHEEQG